MEKRGQIFRMIPGLGTRYAIDYNCNLIYVPTGKFKVPIVDSKGRESYIVNYNGQRRKYSSITLRNRAFGCNKNKIMGDIVNV